MSKTDENTSIKVSSHILIRDKLSNTILINKGLNNSVQAHSVADKVEDKK